MDTEKLNKLVENFVSEVCFDFDMSSPNPNNKLRFFRKVLHKVIFRVTKVMIETWKEEM